MNNYIYTSKWKNSDMKVRKNYNRTIKISKYFKLHDYASLYNILPIELLKITNESYLT